MHEGDIRRAAALLDATVKGPSNGWFHITCPFGFRHKAGVDRNPSMGVSITIGGISRWRCLSCGSGGTLGAILVELKFHGAVLPYGELYEVAYSEEEQLGFAPLAVEEDVPVVVSETWLASFPNVWLIGIASQYLLGRNVPLKLQMQWDLRWDPFKRRIGFPIRDHDGVLRGMQGRAIDDDAEPRYLHYTINGKARGSEYWLNEQRVDLDQPVVLLEGPFDGLSVARVYPNVAVNMGAVTLLSERKLDRLAPAIEVITMFDANTAGDIARTRVRAWCKNKRLCRDARPPADSDPGAMSKDEIRKTLVPWIEDAALVN